MTFRLKFLIKLKKYHEKKAENITKKIYKSKLNKDVKNLHERKKWYIKYE